MKWQFTIFLFFMVGCTWMCTDGACVFDANYGFYLNCVIKKSGLFRVTNLGSIKGYVGLGFSVEDHLGRMRKLVNTKTRSVENNSSFNIGVQNFTAQRLTALPPSTSRVTQEQQPVGVQTMRAPVVFRNSLQMATNHFQVRKNIGFPSDGINTNTLTLGTDTANEKKTSATASAIDSTLQTMSDYNKTHANATDFSEDATVVAIALRQQQQAAAKSTATTTTTTEKLQTVNTVKKYPLAAPSKVMNAPKQYYPVGYDRDFDDNFASRVTLLETSFSCGDQKHLPGLYADESLGCMIGERSGNTDLPEDCPKEHCSDTETADEGPETTFTEEDVAYLIL